MSKTIDGYVAGVDLSSVHNDIIPVADQVYSIGNSTFKFNNGYFAALNASSLTSASALSLNGTSLALGANTTLTGNLTLNGASSVITVPGSSGSAAFTIGYALEGKSTGICIHDSVNNSKWLWSQFPNIAGRIDTKHNCLDNGTTGTMSAIGFLSSAIDAADSNGQIGQTTPFVGVNAYTYTLLSNTGNPITIQNTNTGGSNLTLTLPNVTGNLVADDGSGNLVLAAGKRLSANPIYIGTSAGNSNTTSGIIGIGPFALTNLALSGGTSFTHNLALGSAAMNSIVGNNSSTGSMSINDNVAIGTGAMGAQNGNNAGGTAITIQRNTAIGSGALNGTSVGAPNDNVAVGYNALSSAASDSKNVGVGSSALANMTGSSGQNSGVGYQALYNLSSGSQNVGIGYTAGYQITTASSNTCVGSGTAITAGNSNATAIGQGATTNASNQMMLGNASVTQVAFANGASGTVSLASSGAPLASLYSNLINGCSLRYVSGSISLANFLNMSSVPVALVAAPGAGLYLRLLNLSLKITYGGTPFAAGGSNFWCTYGTNSSTSITAVASVYSSAIITGITSNSKVEWTGRSDSSALATTSFLNLPLSLISSSNFTGGTNSTITYTLTYQIESFP